MNNKIEETIKRIQLLGLDADVKTDEGVRHFHRGHEYVEIGGVKWATMNVGANSVTDGGLYFQWGDTKGWSVEEITNGEKCFDWNNYYVSISQKYNSKDNKKVLELEDDAVHIAWGGDWRMPTVDEFSLLGGATTNACSSDYEGSAISGIVLTSKDSSSIKLFFPSVGYAIGYRIACIDDFGFYWTSSLYRGNCSWLAFKFEFKNTFMPLIYYDSRYLGYPVRGVIG